MDQLTEPRQARSRATLARIAEATEGLLAEKGFDAVTIDDIVRRAGSSKGAFYTRFPSKGALLRYLGTRHFDEALDRWTRFLAPDAWREASVEDIVRGLVARLVGIYRRRGELMRAFVVYARYHGDAAITDQGRRLNEHVQAAIEALLAPRLAGLGHPAPARAVRFGLMAVGSAARDLVLFADPARAGGVDDTHLVGELSALYLRYLQGPIPSTSERSPP